MAAARELVSDGPQATVPPPLRSTGYRGAASLGHGEGYSYPHDFPGSVVEQQYFPDGVPARPLFHPGSCRGRSRGRRPTRGHRRDPAPTRAVTKGTVPGPDLVNLALLQQRPRSDGQQPDSKPVHLVLRGARPCRAALGFPDPDRPHPARSPMPGWSPSSPISWVRRRPPTSGRPPSRRWCAPSTSTSSGAHSATSRSSRCWGTSASATTSRRRRFPGRTSSSPNDSGSIRSASGSPCTRQTTKRSRSGSTPSVPRPIGCSAGARTTSGRWGFPGPVGLARRSSGTRGRSTGRPAGRSGAARSVISRSGTWSSCRTSRTSPIT